MIDLITYSDNTAGLIAELQSVSDKLVSVNDETGDQAFTVPKIPTHRKGSETLSLIRVNSGLQTLFGLDMELSPRERAKTKLSLKKLKILGYYDKATDSYVFNSPADEATYNRLYDRTPITFTDDQGNESTYTPPDMLGVFL